MTLGLDKQEITAGRQVSGPPQPPRARLAGLACNGRPFKRPAIPATSAAIVRHMLTFVLCVSAS